MASNMLSKFKKTFSKKRREGDRRKRNSERPEDNAAIKPEEPGPSCSTQEAKPNRKKGEDERKGDPSFAARGDCAHKTGYPRNEEEMNKEKEGKRNEEISIDSASSLEHPDWKKDCKNESVSVSSRSSLSSAERASIPEESFGNFACENDSLDESLGSMGKDAIPLSREDDSVTSKATNNLSQQDNELIEQLQLTEIINATKDKTDGQQLQLEKATIKAEHSNAVMNLAEHQNLGDVAESTREAEEHSLQVHVQEQAQAKVEPLVSDILSKKDLEDRVCLKLDQGSLVLANWENLACELNAPLKIKAQCKRATMESPTVLLFDSFKSWRQTENLTVNQLIRLLCDMRRMDAVEVIEKAIPVHKRDERVNDEITDNEELLEELSIKLDKESRVLKNWRHLGLKLEVKKEILQEIANGNNPNAVERLFEYIYPTMPGLTVGEFKEKMEKIKRIDVRDLLNDTESGKMNEVIPLHSDLMCSICYMLNKSSPALKNWRHLASELGIDYNTYKSFEPDPPQSPSSILLEWACSEELTIRKICEKLVKIRRFDVIEVLEKEFGQNFRQQP